MLLNIIYVLNANVNETSLIIGRRFHREWGKQEFWRNLRFPCICLHFVEGRNCCYIDFLQNISYFKIKSNKCVRGLRPHKMVCLRELSVGCDLVNTSGCTESRFLTSKGWNDYWYYCTYWSLLHFNLYRVDSNGRGRSDLVSGHLTHVVHYWIPVKKILMYVSMHDPDRCISAAFISRIALSIEREDSIHRIECTY